MRRVTTFPVPASLPSSGPVSPPSNGAATPAPAPSTVDSEFRTEFPFELPRGYLDASRTLHKHGVMRLATARDELIPLRDDRVRENPQYLTVVLLARVVTRIGSVMDVHAGVIEDLFAADLAFLQDMYRRINSEGHTRASVGCPDCGHRFEVDVAGGRLGES